MKKYIVSIIIILTMLLSATTVYAASDPAVIIVNPVTNSTVYSNNLLVSVKISKPKTIRLTVYEEKQLVNGTLSAVNVNRLATSNGTISKASFTSSQIGLSEQFTSTNNLSFYTKQVNNVSPGLYRIKVDTLDNTGKEIFSSENYVAVREKPTTTNDAKIFDTPQSGTLQLLQNILKTIFGN